MTKKEFIFIFLGKMKFYIFKELLIHLLLYYMYYLKISKNHGPSAYNVAPPQLVNKERELKLYSSNRKHTSRTRRPRGTSNPTRWKKLNLFLIMLTVTNPSLKWARMRSKSKANTWKSSCKVIIHFFH